MPNEVLKRVTLARCINKSENPIEIEDGSSAGVFVCTYKELLALPRVALH